uniref:NADH-ubiquinone oxidoreductase chain 6 n=1 Tax=Vagitanus terminalis TaxID=2170276 RepID=A0A344AM18_9HEMI|nr:NADH dehydrogenase subunit 6 [Vagitanus terminalis]
MKLTMMMMLIMSINFMFMKHPLSMGAILFLQTIFSCILCMVYSTSYMFSYILFLVFIGGMLILFMYMSSVASNEKFLLSMKLMFINIMMVLSWFMLSTDLNMKYLIDNMTMYSYNECFLQKLYIIPSGMMTIFIIIYMLYTMVVVINIVSLKMSPLRSSY